MTLNIIDLHGNVKICKVATINHASELFYAFLLSSLNPWFSPDPKIENMSAPVIWKKSMGPKRERAQLSVLSSSSPVKLTPMMPGVAPAVLVNPKSMLEYLGDKSAWLEYNPEIENALSPSPIVRNEIAVIGSSVLAVIVMQTAGPRKAMACAAFRTSVTGFPSAISLSAIGAAKVDVAIDATGGRMESKDAFFRSSPRPLLK